MSAVGGGPPVTAQMAGVSGKMFEVACTGNGAFMDEGVAGNEGVLVAIKEFVMDGVGMVFAGNAFIIGLNAFWKGGDGNGAVEPTVKFGVEAIHLIKEGASDVITKTDDDKPMYYGNSAAERKGWNALSNELKNKVYQAVVATLPDKNEIRENQFIDDYMAFAYVNKENYSELLPMLYERVCLNFQVADFDFHEPIKFITTIPNQARWALLKNRCMRIHFTFVDNDYVDAQMLDGLMEWLEVCAYVNRQIRAKAFNHVRIPWRYAADDDDMMAHLEVECAVSHWDDLGEMMQEYDKIKKAMHKAPVQRYRRYSKYISDEENSDSDSDHEEWASVAYYKDVEW